jgi:hypothetical protein
LNYTAIIAWFVAIRKGKMVYFLRKTGVSLMFDGFFGLKMGFFKRDKNNIGKKA